MACYKAGTFLVHEKDLESARSFYEPACSVYPNSTLLLDGWGYALSKLNRMNEVVAVQRRAVALKPEDPHLLNDLGWTLVETNQYEEAERILLQATSPAPPDYDRPNHNLEELHRQMKTQGSRTRVKGN